MLDTISMAEKLKGEYRNVFEKADMYAAVTDGDTDEKMMDLYDMLLQAQVEEKPVEKIIGEDLEVFCKEFFREEKRERGMVVLFRGLYTWCKVLFVFSLLDFFLLEGGDKFTVESDMMPFICGVIAGVLLSVIFKYVLLPFAFKTKKMKPIVYYLIILALFVGAIVASAVISNVLGLKANVEINTMVLLVVSALYLMIYLVVRSIWRYKKYGRITKGGKTLEEKKMQKTFNEEVFVDSLVKASAKGMASRYGRLNRRNKRKGKEELSFEEFAAKVRKEEGAGGKIEVGMTIFFIAIVVIPAVFEMITNNIVEGLIFGGILAVIEFFIWRFFRKTNRQSSKARLRVLEACEKQGINVVELSEQLNGE